MEILAVGCVLLESHNLAMDPLGVIRVLLVLPALPVVLVLNAELAHTPLPVLRIAHFVQEVRARVARALRRVMNVLLALVRPHPRY